MNSGATDKQARNEEKLPTLTGDTSKYQAQCNECWQIFYSREEFRNHSCAQKKYRCSRCGARFSTEGELDRHALKCFK